MKQQLLQWHNKLVWFGLFSILCWAISGITHPLMAWFGPQSVQMYPPRFQLEATQIDNIEAIIRRNDLQQAVVAKLVPTSTTPMFQVTTNEFLPRRYFSLTTAEEVSNQDYEQAKWLASYYSGLDADQVTDVEFLTEFRHDYPRVNRLLPVYKVSIGQTNDALTLFVYTETNALASINNGSKQRLQSLFQAMHTWTWLDVTGHGRVVLIALLMLTLVTMAITGLMLVVKLPSRKIPDSNRRWHRWAGYLLWLPILAWSASGFYHLLQRQYVEPVSGVRLVKSMNLQDWLAQPGNAEQRNANLDKVLTGVGKINALSLVKTSGQSHDYRLSIAPNPVEVANGLQQRQMRFDGISKERTALYLNSQNGHKLDHTDAAQASILLNQQFEQLPEIASQKLVTRFGPEYDFRNKRLPVWLVNLNDEYQTRFFIDPASNILVDQNRQIDRLESLSFSILHKWNLLNPVIGRQWRDILIISTLFVSILSTVFGLKIYLARNQRKRKEKLKVAASTMAYPKLEP